MLVYSIVIELKDMGGINSFIYESVQLTLDELSTLFFVKLESSNEFSRFLENLNANGKRSQPFFYFVIFQKLSLQKTL